MILLSDFRPKSQANRTHNSVNLNLRWNVNNDGESYWPVQFVLHKTPFELCYEILEKDDLFTQKPTKAPKEELTKKPKP